MKNWKKLLIPGIGGILLGFAAVLAGRRLRPVQLHFTAVPDHLESFVLVTAGTRFECRKTSFKVWSLLGGGFDKDLSGEQNRIYHVTPRTAGNEGEEEQEDAFYATLFGIAPDGRPRARHLAPGCLVEFRECRVGGAVNGVETGRRIRSEEVLVRIDPVSVERGTES